MVRGRCGVAAAPSFPFLTNNHPSAAPSPAVATEGEEAGRLRPGVGPGRKIHNVNQQKARTASMAQTRNKVNK